MRWFDSLRSRTPLSERSLISGAQYAALNEYLFIDRPRLKSYTEQIVGPTTMDKLPNWDISLSITGPRVSGKQNSKERAYTEHEMIGIFTEYLKKHKMLATSRPSYHHDIEQVFVQEQLMASKAIFPINTKTIPNSLKEISVWVSDPLPEDLNGSGYSEGTFLYLIEAYWGNDRQCQTTHSGFSALNLIVSELSNESVLRDVPEPFLEGGDRACYSSQENHQSLCSLLPIEIFRSLGAVIQPPRRIEVLYRKRYITDEQVFKDRNGWHRCNDLFAYPIYIKDLT